MRKIHKFTYVAILLSIVVLAAPGIGLALFFTIIGIPLVIVYFALPIIALFFGVGIGVSAILPFKGGKNFLFSVAATLAILCLPALYLNLQYEAQGPLLCFTRS